MRCGVVAVGLAVTLHRYSRTNIALLKESVDVIVMLNRLLQYSLSQWHLGGEVANG